MIVPRARRGKTLVLAALFACSYAACGAPTPAATAPPPPVEIVPPPEPSVTEVESKPPISPKDESLRLVALAAETKDAHERCRLIHEAGLLDPTALEARRARAASRCAPAGDLLADARAVFAMKKDGDTAALLATVALRAQSKPDATLALDVLETLDLDAKLTAARVSVAVGEHTRAAKIFATIGDERAAKGATADALDARLRGIVEAARGGVSSPKPSETLLAVLPQIAVATKQYGAAFLGPATVEAIGAIRSAGDEAGAALAAVKAASLLLAPEAKRALAIERAIAAARGGKPVPAALIAAERPNLDDAAARALLAVNARATGSCEEARGHVRAHAWLRDESLRLEGDASWAAACGTMTATTVIRPRPSEDVADALAVAEADPLRARARVYTVLAAHPDDVSAWSAAIELAHPSDRAKTAARAAAVLPKEPWLQLAHTDPTAFLAALNGTVEAKIPRATATLLARGLLSAHGDDALAEALLTSCGAGASGPCLEKDLAPALPAASSRLRKSRVAVLATIGPKLSNADLEQPRLRLDVILALIERKDLTSAKKVASQARGPWSGPEASLADASLAAAIGNCTAAKKQAASIPSYEETLAAIHKSCP